MIGAPAPLSRLPQISELMRSESCQSGPRSNKTTFLPARVSTAANTAPAAPAPTIAASTFSSAMSPAPLRQDMRHVRNIDARKAFDGAVDHVDRIVAQHRVDEALRRPFPAFELALAQRIDERPLRRGIKRRIAALVLRLARTIDAGERRAVEICIRRAHFRDPQAQQRMRRRLRQLLIHEMGDAVRARPDRQRLADRFERLDFVRLEHLERHALGAGLPRREPDLASCDREEKRPQASAPDEIPPSKLRHRALLPECLLPYLK